jgi:hypothetical protein
LREEVQPDQVNVSQNLATNSLRVGFGALVVVSLLASQIYQNPYRQHDQMIEQESQLVTTCGTKTIHVQLDLNMQLEFPPNLPHKLFQMFGKSIFQIFLIDVISNNVFPK